MPGSDRRLYWRHGDRLAFRCPGCDMVHEVRAEGTQAWRVLTDPLTLAPSVLVRWGGTGRVCHSFVEQGRIRFLEDSTHALAGKTVDLPLFENPYALL